MANGISCAIFALKNHDMAKKDDNPFREGIAGIQTVRTADAFASTLSKVPVASLAIGRGAKKSSAVASNLSKPLINSRSPFKKTLGKLARWGRKLVYPLIWRSGISTTLKSKDKVKTGASQAAGITTMYYFEKVSEKILKSCSTALFKKLPNNKLLRSIWPVVQGLAFVGASLAGFDVGSKLGTKVVEKLRSDNVIPQQKNKIDNVPLAFKDMIL